METVMVDPWSIVRWSPCPRQAIGWSNQIVYPGALHLQRSAAFSYGCKTKVPPSTGTPEPSPSAAGRNMWLHVGISNRQHFEIHSFLWFVRDASVKGSITKVLFPWIARAKKLERRLGFSCTLELDPLLWNLESCFSTIAVWHVNLILLVKSGLHREGCIGQWPNTHRGHLDPSLW